jgi:hypothetical protein
MRRTSWLLATGCTLALSTLSLITPARAQHAVAAPGWSKLFDRSSGWTGADGIFSFSLDGWDAPADPHGPVTTLFVFSDTFIGTVNTQGARVSGVQLVHNTAARLRGTAPLPSAIGFTWGHAGGKPAPLITPQTPQTQPGEWYWPVDGVVTGGSFYLFSQRMAQTQSGGTFDFAVVGVDLISEPTARIGDPGAAPAQADTPLFLAANATRGVEQFGNAVMANTTEAGSPLADGYVYVYGLQNDATTKWLLAARVPAAGIADFSQYRFWNGSDWVADINQSTPIIDRLSSEFSVTPLADGRYALVYQLDTLSNKVAISYGPTPVGPFSAAQVIFHCPEPAQDPSGQVYTYNAKAHPALSQPGHLLISYNVNSFSLQENLQDAAIYHPRFIDFDLTH